MPANKKDPDRSVIARFREWIDARAVVHTERHRARALGSNADGARRVIQTRLRDDRDGAARGAAPSGRWLILVDLGE